MSEIVTLELPESLAQRAHAVAEQTQRRLEEVLIDWLDQAATDLPVESLPDDQILALRDSTLDTGSQQELSRLLAQQREGMLAPRERERLELLMRVYRRGLIRKAQALQVAVERGLQLPLS